MIDAAEAELEKYVGRSQQSPHRTGVDKYPNLLEFMFCCVRSLQLGGFRTVFQTKLSIFLGAYRGEQLR